MQHAVASCWGCAELQHQVQYNAKRVTQGFDLTFADGRPDVVMSTDACSRV